MSCRMRGFAGFAGLGLAVSACSGSLTDSGEATSEVTVSLRRVGAAQGAAGPSAQGLELAMVQKLEVTVTGIEFLPEGEAEENGGAWERLEVDDVTLNLMALPIDPAAPVVLVTGTLPAGPYRMLRLFVSDPTVWFNTTVELGTGGAAFTFQPDTPYPVFIPSGNQTGIKITQGFELADDADQVTLLFDENATVANLTVTGSGMVIMAPVLRQAPEE